MQNIQHYQNPLLAPSHISESHIKPRLIQHSLEDVTLSIQNEKNTILWHDPSISSPQNQKMYHILDLITNLKGFGNCEEVIKYIQENKTGKFSVLTAGTNGEILTKTIVDLPQVSAVYVFCGNVPFHQSWALHYPKVGLVASDPMRLILKIFHDLTQRATGHGSIKIDLPVFLECYEAEGAKEYKMRNSQFNRIIAMEDYIAARKDLGYLMKHIIVEGEAEIEKFENEYLEYDMKKILNWYTESELIGRMTTHCLKQGSPDAIYYGRALLRDLEKAINEQYWKSSKEFQGNVYRNMFITEGQWEKLKENEGKEIAFVDYFRASKNKEESIKYLKLGLGLNILITIQVQGLTKEQGKGLAELKEFSNAENSLEVVFSAFSRFTIQTVVSKNIEGKEVDRELVLVFGGIAQGQVSAAQDCITFAQCMVCLGVLETGLEEKIDPAVHYICNKCPNEHIAGGGEGQKFENPLMNFDLLGKEIDIGNLLINESVILPIKKKEIVEDIGQKFMGFQPNYSLLSKEIDIASLEAFESLIIPVKKQEQDFIPIPVVFKEEKPGRKEEKKEEDYAVIIKDKSNEIPAGIPEKLPVSNGGGQQIKTAYGNDDDEEEEDEDEEDEEHERLLELYVRAKVEFEGGNYKEALKWYEEIFKNSEKLDKILLGKCLTNVNVCYEKVGDNEKIVERLLKSLEEKKKSLGRDHVEVKSIYKELANLFTKLSVE